MGRSEDEKSLIFAAGKGERGGSFEVAITRQLRELVGEDEAVPSTAATEAMMPAREHVRILPGPQRPGEATTRRRARGLAPGAFEKATGFGGSIPEPRGVRALIGGGEIVSGGRGGLAAVPAESQEALSEGSIPASGQTEGAGGESEGPARGSHRAATPATSRQKLSAAEIQTLLRAGRSVGAVAKLAGASRDWVQRLDETVQMERIAVVRQLLGAHMTRDRIGDSELPVGEALLGNLRKRRVRYPERVLQTGWSASRPRGKEWRVRFTYRYRDKRRQAEWSYDPKTGEVLALTNTAAELAWASSTNPESPSDRRGGRARGPKRRS